MWSIAALTCGAKKVYGFDPLIENKVANDDSRYNWKVDNFAERVDRLVRKGFNPPSVIKIDVQGEELEVLKGAEQTIIKYRPAMCIEAHEIITRGIPEVTQVTGLKQKDIDLLDKWIGRPSDILDQNVKSFGFVYHITYMPQGFNTWIA
jgi:hypothetical protein